MTHTNPLFDTVTDAALAARFNDADAAVRRLAVLEAADLEDEAWLPLLADALRHDTDADVRRTAAQRLGAWETDEAVDALCAALDDADTDTREAAADSLAALKDPVAGERLLPHLADADTDADAFKRAALLRALRELRLPSAAGPALAALANASPFVRREAIGVLG